MTVSLIDTAIGKIEYSLHGQGKPILFVHGGHINCRETLFLKGLDPNKYCLITPSRPGYGKTPLTGLNKTAKGTADLFISLLNFLNLPKVIVVGISAGGLTALEIAANYPERIESLVLMSALTKKMFAETDKHYTGGKKLFAPKMEPFTWFIYRNFFKLFPTYMSRKMFKEMSKYRPIVFPESECLELKKLTSNMRSGYGFSNDLDQIIDDTVLPRIQCSTLILHSENDNAVDISHAQNAKANIKNSRQVLFKNRWGHLLWIGID